MIYLTQLIYIKEGEEDSFNQFEAIAIPLIRKYNGRLLLRIRPGETTTIDGDIETPYEIHLVEFRDDNDLKEFTADPERKKILHLKEKAIRSVMLIKGDRIS